MKKLLALAVVILGFTAVSFGQTSVTIADAQASATVLQSLTMVNSTPLSFGTVGPTGANSTVIIGLGDARSGSANLFAGVAGKVQKTAVFDIAGANGNSFVLTLPSSDVILKNALDATKTMTVNTWVTTLGAYPAVKTGALAVADGKFKLEVGATLNVGASQTAGDYTGTYSITVDYN